MRKKIFIASAILVLVVVVIIAYAKISIANSDLKFKNTKINTSIDSIRQEWGQPMREFMCKICNNRYVVVYKRDMAGSTQYVFIFDENNKLAKKVIDD